MAVPNKYQVTEPAIASFDFTDIASGTGVQRFYLFESEDDSTKDYHLTSNIIFSNTIIYLVTVGASGTNDLDFDLTPFNLPRTIEGIGLANLSVKTANSASDIHCICKLRKWNGTTETDLVTFTTPTLSGTSAFQVFSVPFTIPKTPFKKGDTLRFTVDVISVTAAGAFFIDPKDRTFETATTTASFIDIPFRIDL